MARGDLFGQTGREPESARCVRVHVGTEVGAVEFSVLGRRPGAGGAAETLMGKPDPTHATKMRRMHREPGEKAVS